MCLEILLGLPHAQGSWPNQPPKEQELGLHHGHTEHDGEAGREGRGGLEYVAKPSGQPEATFTATRASAREILFENPAHDFPKKIHYTRDGDALTAAIEGPMNGQSRRIEFAYMKGCGS